MRRNHREYVGLGCLGHYPDNAKALSHTTTAIYSRDDFARLTENSRELRAIQAAAIENEFEFVKRSIEPARRTPTEAVAAYLVAISSLNAREGRDPRIVDADVNSGIVADLLHMDIYTLQKALIELKRYNLIGVDDDGAIRLNEPLLLAALTDNEEA